MSTTTNTTTADYDEFNYDDNNNNNNYVYLDLNGHTLDSSFLDPTYTYSYDKYSCVSGFFIGHLVMNYFIFLSGIGCMVCRLWWTHLHAWFGRIYILSMLWSTATSLLIHNTGLPLSTIISFACVNACLTIGWIIIIVYKQQINREATLLVQERLIEKTSSSSNNDDTAATIDLAKMQKEAVGDVIDKMSFVKRYFSWKTLHGVLFFTSWFQIAGRIFASNQAGDFTCYTYPVYKPIDTQSSHGPDSYEYENENVTTLVPEHDPNYDNLPWAGNVVGWSLGLVFGSALGAIVVGAIWNYILVRRAHKRRQNNADKEKSPPSPVAAADEDGVAKEEVLDEAVPNEEETR